VQHFGGWGANFAEEVAALELALDGSGYRMHTRFAKFINLPELPVSAPPRSGVRTAFGWPGHLQERAERGFYRGGWE
jgi:hypothetical protein